MRKLFAAVVALMLLATSVAALSGFAQQGDGRSSGADRMSLESSQPRRVAILLQGLGSETDRAFCTWYELQAVLRSMGTYDDIVKFSYKSPGEPYSAEDTYKNVLESVEVLGDTVDDYLGRYPQPEFDLQFDLIGHSLGGVVAFLYAASYGLQDPALGHIRHVATLDSPVNGSHLLYIINSGQQADRQDELEVIFGTLGLTSDAARYLAMMHQVGFYRVSLFKAKELGRNGVMVRAFSSISDLAISTSDALIRDPTFQWSEDLGTDHIPGPCDGTQIFDFSALLGHNQILHHPIALQAIKDFLSEAPPPEPTPLPPPSPPTTDNATFVSDITIPDGTPLSPGQSFTKIWLMRNNGTSTWDSGYQLAFVGGHQMGAPSAVSVPTTAPGSTANISVSMTAPSNPGTYQSNWRMRNAQGVFFGEPVWVVIVVPPPAPPTTDDVELVSCSFSPTTLTSGGTLRVDFTVRNHGDNTVSTQGPDPGYVYQEGQSSDTIGHPDIPGRWRVAVEYGDRPETIKDHPYRWGLGGDLAPGEIRTVSGYITLNTIKRTDYWCALVHEQIGGGEDYVGGTTITVQEPDRIGPKIVSHHFEPSSPSNTGVVQVCAEAQDNPGGVGVDHIGVCINGCQYNESIWGAGGCVPWESGHPTYTPGVHDVQIMAVDRNGNWGASVWTCYTIGDRDITAPRVKNILFSPPSGSTESGTTSNVHIRVEWEDPCGESGIQSTTVFATDCTFGNPPLGSRTWSPAEFDWYVGCLPKGRYTVDVYMQDYQGNARSEFFPYQRGVNDEMPPTGSILVNPTPRDSWTVEYTADALPRFSTPPWQRWESLGYEIIENGVLRSRATDPSHFNYYRQEANLSNQTGTTLEARLKVVSGQPLSTGAIGNNISIFDDARKIRLAIFPDGIRLGDCHVCDEYQMNTTDDFHVYRLTLEGDTAKAYVDGILRLTGTPVANSAWTEIWFGNDWMGGPDEGLWDYVRYYTGGAIPPPWSVEYTGDALPLNSTPPWERLNQGGYESVSNGILRSGTPDNDHFNYYRQITDVSNETGATLEGRLKVVNGQPLSTRAIGNHITIFDDARKIRLAIFPDGIRLGDCEVCDEYPMVTTDDFHVYRLTLQGDTAKAYVDGVLRLSGTAVENLAWTGIWFGNDWMGGPDEGLWDYVRYYTGGAIAPSADVTRNPEVVLALTAKDEGWGLSQMNIGVCNSDEEEYELLGWEPFAAKRSVTLPPGDGLKYVKVQYSDRAENRSDWYHDTIILDTTPPTSTVSALPAMQTASSFAVGWSGTDSPIDVAKFDVQYKDTTSVQRASSSSSDWTNWYSGTTLSSALFTGEYGHTYYFRTRAKDIAGNVEEYPAGDGDAYTEICFLPADAFESDDTSGSATLIATTGVTQTHNFHVAEEDEDWFKFTIAADATYIIQTRDLGSSADTYIYLYDTDATTLLNANDDYGGTLASQIEWQAPMDGTYYLMVKHWNPYVGGCGTEYNIAVRLLGDLDGNCVVDIVDIMLVASRWNTTVDDDNYDPAYDLDGDGDIDIVDIMKVAAHWGETCE